MLGKGLESLIPPQKGDSHTIHSSDPTPPMNLPVAENLSLEPEVLIEPPKTEEIIAQVIATPVSAPSPIFQKIQEAKKEIKEEKKIPEAEKKPAQAVFYLEVEKIKPNPQQPRRHFQEEAIRDLAASIREFGVLQPIVVTKKYIETPTGTNVEYELIAGERRLMAVKLLGLPTIPAIIRNVDLERERLELAVIENLQREDLNPIEMARAFARLQDEFRLTQREIAVRLGKSRETVANTLRLLDLPMQIQEALTEGKISESHGRMLLTIADPAAQQKIFEELLRSPMTIRELKSKMRSVASPEEKIEEEKPLSPELKLLQDRLSSELGAPVAIREHGGTGRITINFYSPEELQNILSKLAKPDEF